MASLTLATTPQRPAQNPYLARFAGEVMGQINQSRIDQLTTALQMAASFIESGESSGHNFFETRNQWGRYRS